MFRFVFVVIALISSTQLKLPNSMKLGQEEGLDHASRFLGVESCTKCHQQQFEKLKSTKHFQSFETLHRTPEAQAYCKQLQVRSMKRSTRCVRCHYTPTVTETERIKAASGISCENCHGPSKDWLPLHNLYGSLETTKEEETVEHQKWRVAASIQRKMRHPSNVFLLARSCYECHLVDDAELVNKTNHTAVTVDFDFSVWSQGQMRHNFFRTEGQSNALSDMARRRLMFVSDLIAACEFGSRALAVSEPGSRHFEQVSKVLNRKRKLLEQVLDRTGNPLVADSLSIVKQIREVGWSEERQTLLYRVGVEFAAGTEAAGLDRIDDLIPPVPTDY